VYVGWGGARLDGGGRRFGIPMQLAACLELREGLMVDVTPMPGCRPSRLVMVEPESADDWEILELNAEYIESKLLDQINVVTENKRFPFWIRNNQLIFLKAVPGYGPGFAKLARNSEISVAPKVRSSFNRKNLKERRMSNPKFIAQVRVQPLPHMRETAGAVFQKQRAAFVTKVLIRDLGCQDGDLICIHARNSRILDSKSAIMGHKTFGSSKLRVETVDTKDTVYLHAQGRARILKTVVRVFSSDRVAAGHVIIPRMLREHLAIPLFSTIHLIRLSKSSATFCKRIRNVILQMVRFKNGPQAAWNQTGNKSILFSPTFEKETVRAFKKWIMSHNRSIPVLEGSLISLNVEGKPWTFALHINRNLRPSKESKSEHLYQHQHNRQIDPESNGANPFDSVFETIRKNSHPQPNYSNHSVNSLSSNPYSISNTLNATNSNPVTPTSYYSSQQHDSSQFMPLPHSDATSLTPTSSQSYHLQQQSLHSLAARTGRRSIHSIVDSVTITYFKLPLDLIKDGASGADTGRKNAKHSRRSKVVPASVSVEVNDVAWRTGLCELLTRGHFPIKRRSAESETKAGTLASARRISWLSPHSSLETQCLGDMAANATHLGHLGAIDSLKQKLTRHIDAVLFSGCERNSGGIRIDRESAAGVIVTGQMGSGKSTLLQALAVDYGFRDGIPAQSLLIGCSELVNEKTAVIRQIFSHSFQLCLRRAPSMLLFDDIDQLIPALDEQQSPANLRYLQLAECFIDIMSSVSAFTKSNPVVVVATAKSMHSFCPALQMGGVLATKLQILPPNPDGRKDIFQKVFELRGVVLHEDIDLRSLSYLTEGYVGLDIVQLVERIVHAATTRALLKSLMYPQLSCFEGGNKGGFQKEKEEGDIPSPCSTDLESSSVIWYDSSSYNGVSTNHRRIDEENGNICGHSVSDRIPSRLKRNEDYGPNQKVEAKKCDLDSALEGFVPVSLQGLPLQKSSTTWRDIGGLETVKETLKETLELPTRYAPLFATVPLKLRSGILLYGPPGCGKTLLASAVAKECGLNFISIKGPELLNKYIGASEQAVRDAFAKAEAARPCVLFFDEFEAICPARGADSTGVTDRVVNQMLCHLDGVEGRKQVYILAASSRPDLIDPALLRPGRLDKSLFCGFPNEKERRGILRALSRNLNLERDVDFKQIAARTENYSGADLKGILNDAQLLVVHSSLGSTKKRMESGLGELENGHDDDMGAEDHHEGGKDAMKENQLRGETNLRIRQEHLMQALQGSSKSISERDRKRYEKIYSKFIRSREDRSDQKFGEGELRTTFA